MTMKESAEENKTDVVEIKSGKIQGIISKGINVFKPLLLPVSRLNLAIPPTDSHLNQSITLPPTYQPITCLNYIILAHLTSTIYNRNPRNGQFAELNW